MAEETPPGTAGTTPSDTEPKPSKDDALIAALGAMTKRIEALESGGATRDDATAQVAQQIGWKAEDLASAINEAAGAGNPGEGFVKAMGVVMGSMDASTRDREGRREVSGLAGSRKFGEAFEKHERAFRKWLGERNVQYGAFANPGAAQETFDYFLKTSTNWYEEQSAAREIAARAEERKKVEEELRLRRSTPASPSLSPGARTEGGALRALVTTPNQSSAEPTENQTAIMGSLGLTEEQQKKAMETQAKKTAFGVPLDFVPTRNSGAV